MTSKLPVTSRLRAGATAVVGGIVLGLFAANSASATLALTPDGIADGFVLSTFATTNPGNTGCCNGPFGIAVNGAGNVLVGTGAGPLYVFPDVDGQTPATALFTQVGGTFTHAFTTSGGIVYGGVGGNYVSFNPDGTVANANVFPLLSGEAFLGMWTNPVNGHLVANSGLGMIDINPATGNFFVITSSTGDGVSVSPDGKTAYLEQGSINGYTIAPGGAQVFNSGFQFPSPEGTGVISGGTFNGDIIVNDNSGSIFLLDPITKVSTEVATGGTRGDYTQVDQTNGSLLLDYSDIVARLTCPDCSFVPPSTPEPATSAMMLIGFAGLGFLGYRRARIRPAVA
jgi:PEP-CTERM motif